MIPISIRRIFAASGPWRRRLPRLLFEDVPRPLPRFLAFWTARMRSALLCLEELRPRFPEDPARLWELFPVPRDVLFLFKSLISSHLQRPLTLLGRCFLYMSESCEY